MNNKNRIRTWIYIFDISIMVGNRVVKIFQWITIINTTLLLDYI